MNANRKNLIAIVCVFGVMGMTGAAFAAVPLYRMFCQVTGFGGTTMKADKASDIVLDETVLVRFDPLRVSADALALALAATTEADAAQTLPAAAC